MAAASRHRGFEGTSGHHRHVGSLSSVASPHNLRLALRRPGQADAAHALRLCVAWAGADYLGEGATQAATLRRITSRIIGVRQL